MGYQEREGRKAEDGENKVKLSGGGKEKKKHERRYIVVFFRGKRQNEGEES